MPLFSYYCIGCDKTFKRLLKDRKESVICSCGDHLTPELPTSLNAVTKELKDPYRGVSHVKGLKQQLTKRMNQHHDSYEVAQKIDEFGVDDAKKHGWDKRIKRT